MGVSQVMLSDAITRLRAPLVDAGYGNVAPDWSAPATAQFNVHWSMQSVSEVVGDEPQVTTRAKVFGGPDLDLEATDRVIGPDGELYEVDGDVMRSYKGGQLHHVRAFLKRVSTTGT